MARLTLPEYAFIGFCLEGFFFGLYSSIFAIYLQHQASKILEGTDMTKKSLFYALCALYILSVATVAGDIANFFVTPQTDILLGLIQDVVNGCCDFISQSILIYRCWIVWGGNIYVVIIPSVLAFAFLVMWLLTSTLYYILSERQVESVPDWLFPVSATSFAASLTVNALVTSLIVFRILKVYRQVRPTLYDQSLGSTDGSKFRSILSIIIESGMALFAIQSARFVVNIVVNTQSAPPEDASGALQLIIGIHEMLNGITPTIIQVRVSMGLSFYDKKSMEEPTSSLQFASDHSIQETASFSIVRPESRDGIGIQPSNDVDG